jgi:hypothetical protein
MRVMKSILTVAAILLVASPVLAECSAAGSLAPSCNFTSGITGWNVTTGVISHNTTEGYNALGSLQCIGLGAGAWIWCTVYSDCIPVSPNTAYGIGIRLKLTAPPAVVTYYGPFGEIRWQEFVESTCTTSTGSPQVVSGSSVNPISSSSFDLMQGTITTSVLGNGVTLQPRVLNQDGNDINNNGFTVVFDDVAFGVGLPVELQSFEIE